MTQWILKLKHLNTIISFKVQRQKSPFCYRPKGTTIPLITSLQNVPSQHTLLVLNSEHNEAQEEYTYGGDSVPFNTPTSLRPDADIEDRNLEQIRPIGRTHMSSAASRNYENH